MISWKIKGSGIENSLTGNLHHTAGEQGSQAIPKLAKIIMFLKEMAFEPMAELRKFTASLLTPTIKSPIATDLIKQQCISKCFPKNILY